MNRPEPTHYYEVYKLNGEIKVTGPFDIWYCERFTDSKTYLIFKIRFK